MAGKRTTVAVCCALTHADTPAHAGTPRGAPPRPGRDRHGAWQAGRHVRRAGIPLGASCACAPRGGTRSRRPHRAPARQPRRHARARLGRTAVGSVLHTGQHAAVGRRSGVRRRRLWCHRPVRRRGGGAAGRRGACVRAAGDPLRRGRRPDRRVRDPVVLRGRRDRRAARRRVRGLADALLVGDHRATQGGTPAGQRSAVRIREPRRPAARRGDGVRSGQGVPDARAALPLRAAGVVDDGAPQRRDPRADGALRRAGLSRRDRPRTGDARGSSCPPCSCAC